MINPAPLSLTLCTGLTFGPIILHAKDVNNQPVDLTGWKVWAEVRKKPGAAVVLDLQPFFSNAGIGDITIPKLTDEQTYDLKVGDYQWDLIMEDPTGDRHGIYVSGGFTITASITKPAEGVLHA